ncbi:MAG: hypothetical protein GVY08_02380 [Bacteroidetes bacterium]|jgi:hypothetical protein|nr:hypothetical protein [Bacteroidota bacterium]
MLRCYPAFSIHRYALQRAVLLVACVCITAAVCPAQQGQISHKDYARAIGMEDHYLVMGNILMQGLRREVPGNSDRYYRDNASFFSLILLLSDVEPADYYSLDRNGIDLIHAISASDRPFTEQSLLADVVVEGTVTNVLSGDDRGDGFDVTVEVTADEIYKGDLPTGRLTIRQRDASRLPGSDTRPLEGESYLFFLSSGVYGYQKANHQFQTEGQADVTPPEFGSEEMFVIYRLYLLGDGTILTSGQSTETVKKQLQAVHQLIHR